MGDRDDLISADDDLMQDDFVGHPATWLNCFRSPRDLALMRDDAVILIYFRSLPLPPPLLFPFLWPHGFLQVSAQIS